MADESAFHLGEDLDEAGERSGRRTEIEPGDLTTHGVILGMTGSGQTGLGMGGRKNVPSLSGVASRRGITRRTQERLDTAEGRLEDIAEEMTHVEEDLADDIVELQEKRDACAARIETKTIPLEKNDVAVDGVVLLWVPVE